MSSGDALMFRSGRCFPIFSCGLPAYEVLPPSVTKAAQASFLSVFPLLFQGGSGQALASAHACWAFAVTCGCAVTMSPLPSLLRARREAAIG